VVSVSTAAHCFDVQFHPREPLLAAATITGAIELHRFDAEAETTDLLRTIQNHKESCRTARFLVDAGDSQGAPAPRLASAASNGFTVLSDVETGKRLWRTKLQAGGNALLPLSSERFAVGDDEGGIAVYDVRKRKVKKPVVEYAENSDFITDLAYAADKQTLCATSGDGTLAVYDLRKNGTPGLVAMSDFQEDEFLSLDIVRNGTKVICGSQTGVLCIFSWGDFGDQKDRITGHPMSVDALVKVAEDGVITGSSDGMIRVVAVHSIEHGSAIIGNIGEHGEDPIERLALSADGELIASASHGQPSIQVWQTAVAHRLLTAKSGQLASAYKEKEAGSDDSDSSEDAPKKKKRRKGKRKNRAAANTGHRAASFFAEL